MSGPLKETAEGQKMEDAEPGISKIGKLAFWRDLLLVVSITIAGLYYAQGFLIPLALALLLFILLTALIDRIAQIAIGGKSMPVWLAHILGILVIVIGFAGVFSILSIQASEVAAAIPRYTDRFTKILATIVATIGDENAVAIKNMMANLNVSSYAAKTLGSAGAAFSSFMLIALYIPFLMLERSPMRKKMQLAVHDSSVGERLDTVLISITSGIQHYIEIKTAVSVLTGVLTYAIMRAVGLDFAETWAIMIFMLNFIPTIGSIFAVVVISIVALVQFETYTPFLIVAIGGGLVQFVVGSVLEPPLMGKSLNLSPMMVLIALTFWGSLWGLSGAFLSVPITVCVLIFLSNITNTRWIAVLMSGDGKLSADIK
ncbi:MAG: AI-2E family transporter [Rhizobiaceae bacterium]|nr:AI-2E family transporter [Rhizobiaceae bacterium]